ncbi:hypothetical protein PTKIN_Ptkin14bG0034900 [Pterospermum kingtungense]
METCSKSMAHAMLSLMVFSFLFIPASTLLESNQQGYISAVISDKGLDFAKDVLIQKAVSSMIPLQLSDVDKSLKIPVIGKVHLGLSNIIIYSVDVANSYVETGDSGIVLVASGATANLSMDWRYSYKTWLVPIRISDQGSASVQVQGMVVGLSVAIINQEGTLKLILLGCGCHVKDIFIKVDGGASWLYQGIVGAFEGKIVSAVEDAVTEKIREGITKLDSLLQSLPKQMQVNDVVALNVTFVDDPLLSNSSVELQINGLFTAADRIPDSNSVALNVSFMDAPVLLTNSSLELEIDGSVSNYCHEGSQSFFSCKGSAAKMVEISLNENVFQSAASVYFQANYLHWTVDKIPEQWLMNTAGWRYIIPQLYEKYPNDDINLSIAVTSPPNIRIADHDIDTTIYTELIIEVLNSGEVVPVACISLVISASGSAKISRNKLAGKIRLVNFTASLKWSNIGKLHMHLIQGVMSTILKTFLMPYLNSHLRRGFPLPLPHGFTLHNAEILLLDSRIIVRSDLKFTDRYDLNQLPSLL